MPRGGFYEGQGLKNRLPKDAAHVKVRMPRAMLEALNKAAGGDRKGADWARAAVRHGIETGEGLAIHKMPEGEKGADNTAVVTVRLFPADAEELAKLAGDQRKVGAMVRNIIDTAIREKWNITPGAALGVPVEPDITYVIGESEDELCSINLVSDAAREYADRTEIALTGTADEIRNIITYARLARLSCKRLATHEGQRKRPQEPRKPVGRPRKSVQADQRGKAREGAPKQKSMLTAPLPWQPGEPEHWRTLSPKLLAEMRELSLLDQERKKNADFAYHFAGDNSTIEFLTDRALRWAEKEMGKPEGVTKGALPDEDLRARIDEMMRAEMVGREE